MQTIIGSGGAIGVPLAEELKKYTDRIRLVSRNPVRVNATDELFPLDVTDSRQLDKAIAGSTIVYVTIGFRYNLKVWQTVWPPFMKAVINACISNHSKLVFFDNVYLYDKSAIPFMTEESVINPPSRKGEVRKEINEMLMHGISEGKLEALIARAADFYGPVIRGSMLGEMVISNLLKDKNPMAFGNIDRMHTYTFTPDAGKAVALLGNTPGAFGQVWHLPTTKEKLTNREWIGLIADKMTKKAKIRVVPEWVVNLAGIMVPLMREFPEMMYQFESDYIFDSSKFERRFNVKATSPAEGIKMSLEAISGHIERNEI
ncbi:MAG TPA: NAD-dependent epimerase/dehydratase family protein [Bacteroidales bacterium]|nr:NAD-dependent epimerase/dehydratase family protein [Bacteroidales bacterium]